jgi:hypothetical protein
MDAQTLADAIAIADAAPTVRAAAAALRARFAPMRVVVVDAFDMRHEKPAASGATHQLYLGASDGHCWTVTTSPEQATGLFIAERG